MVNKTAASQSDPSLPIKIEVTSNTDAKKVVSLLGGFVELTYYESILQDTIKVSYFFADAGNSIDGKSVAEGLPLVGTEDVRLEFEDNNENRLKLDLNVNSITPVYEDTGKSIVSLSLVSEEFIRNEESTARVKVRYDGPIDETIKRILKENLKSTKKVKDENIETVKENYNFFGNGRKPFYILNYLSKCSVPKDGDDKSAGFFFFETSEGYHFKSIDTLFSQQKKKSFIYNESTDRNGGVPAGYDGKILELSTNNAVNVQEKMEMGSYKTKLVLFDPFNCKYEFEIREASDEQKLAGKELPKLNKKFDSDYTRTTYMIVDSGTLPAGNYVPGSKGKDDKQVRDSQQDNFKVAETLNQAIRRYNQVFSQTQEITIAGDFSLHAGDVIFVDIPPIKAETDDTLNKQAGGLYIIADLCHFVNADGTWTKLNLARDSFGRKGNHSNR